MAAPGFGKRNADGQTRSRKGVFDNLSDLAASVAHYIERLPPILAAEDEPEIPGRAIVECSVCRVPGRPHVMLGGLCRGCRGERSPATVRNSGGLRPGQVRRHAMAARAGIMKGGRGRVLAT
jgi:hypothetical protein